MIYYFGFKDEQDNKETCYSLSNDQLILTLLPQKMMNVQLLSFFHVAI